MVGGKRLRLGEILIRAGVLEEAQLEQALAHQKETREPIGEILVKMGFVTEEKIKYALELQFGVKHINLKQARIPPEVLKLIPEQAMREFLMVPVAVNQLTVALVDPNNILAIDEIRHRLKGVNVVPAVCTESDFWETLKAIPKDASAAGAAAPAAPGASKSGNDIPVVTDAQLKEMMDKATKGGGEAAIAPLVNALLASAVRRRASHLFLEPMENEIAIRYRVDGHVLREQALPAKVGAAIVSRVKVLAGLAVTSGSTPQSGTFSFVFDGRPVKIAFNSMPARFGQVMTVRFFDSAMLATQGLDTLIGHQRVGTALRQLLARPSGLVLFTGPKGAGKTLLMYACLKEMQKQGANAITVEDPIEFDLDGIVQVSVAKEPGSNDMPVLAGLNSAMQQSPDVLMMGDVDDAAIAQRLVRGALSGTLMLAGLTTTQGALVEAKESWEVPTRHFANALAGLVTQRLVRRLCPDCKTAYQPDERLTKFFARFNGTGQLCKAAGCENCYRTGFAGQVGVYEVVPFTPQVRELVARNAPKAQIDQVIRQMGLLTLEDYALWLVSQGLTTMEEIKRTDILELVQSGQAAAEPTVEAAVPSA